MKYATIDYPGNAKLSYRNIDSQTAEFCRRLAPAQQKNDWGIETWFWVYRQTTEENIEVCRDILRLILDRGLDYFHFFSESDKYLGSIDPHTVSEFRDFSIQRFFGRGTVGLLFFLATYWKIKGNKEKALAFVQEGLQVSECSDTYENAFRILEENLSS